MELREYWRVIRKHLWLVLIIPIVAASVSILYSYKIAKPTYRGTATVLMNVDPNSMPDPTTLNGIVTSKVFDGAVLQQFPKLVVDPSLFPNLISVTTSGKLVTITAVGSNQPMAAALANDIAQTMVDRGSIVGLPSSEMINPANPSAPPILPKRKRSVIMAFIIGLLLSLGIAFFREYLDMRIKSEADMSRFLNIPVLGSVEEYKNKVRKSKKSAVRQMG